LRCQVTQQILVRAQASGTDVHAPVPFVQNESKGAPTPLFEKKLPADLIVVLLLRSDVEHNVGNRQHEFQALAIGGFIAVEIRRIDNDFMFKRRPIVRREPAMTELRGQAVRLDRLVIVHNRVACRRPGERCLRDGSAGQCVQ
jgi:hypothetical protein